MISENTRQLTSRTESKRQADAAKALPVRFIARTPMYFRAERYEAGATITATPAEAVELYGTFRVELADAADLTRIRESASEAAAEHARDARRSVPGWIKGGTPY